MATVKATARGYAGTPLKVREIDEVFEYVGPPASWLVLVKGSFSDAPAPAAAPAPAKEPFGGKGDHDGDGHVGGGVPAADEPVEAVAPEPAFIEAPAVVVPDDVPVSAPVPPASSKFQRKGR